MAPPSTPDCMPAVYVFDSPIVTLKIGSEGNGPMCFHVHKGLLTFFSTYSGGALKGQFAEAKSNNITLKDRDPDIFDIVIYWLYKQRFTSCAPEDEAKQMSWMILAKFWGFGDAHGIPGLQNQIMDAILRKLVADWIFPKNILRLGYDNTTGPSQFRRYCVETLAYAGSAETCMDPKVEAIFPRDAQLDIMRLTWAQDKPSTHWKRDEITGLEKCRDHVHEEGTSCAGAVNGNVKTG